MKQYELYYKGNLIGKLEISDKIKYTVVNNNIYDVFNFLKEDMDYLHSFLELRIEKMNAFNLESISFLNDSYKLVLIK
jgi:hypothetical protein